MALFIPGMKCPICQQPILGDHSRRLFPPFITDEKDPLYVFHDATVHEECFQRHPLASQALERLRVNKKRGASA